MRCGVFADKLRPAFYCAVLSNVPGRREPVEPEDGFCGASSPSRARPRPDFSVCTTSARHRWQRYRSAAGRSALLKRCSTLATSADWIRARSGGRRGCLTSPPGVSTPATERPPQQVLEMVLAAAAIGKPASCPAIVALDRPRQEGDAIARLARSPRIGDSASVDANTWPIGNSRRCSEPTVDVAGGDALPSAATPVGGKVTCSSSGRGAPPSSGTTGASVPIRRRDAVSAGRLAAGQLPRRRREIADEHGDWGPREQGRAGAGDSRRRVSGGEASPSVAARTPPDDGAAVGGKSGPGCRSPRSSKGELAGSCGAARAARRGARRACPMQRRDRTCSPAAAATAASGHGQRPREREPARRPPRRRDRRQHRRGGRSAPRRSLVEPDSASGAKARSMLRAERRSRLGLLSRGSAGRMQFAGIAGRPARPSRHLRRKVLAEDRRSHGLQRRSRAGMRAGSVTIS